jgi:hypothetical protein
MEKLDREIGEEFQIGERTYRVDKAGNGNICAGCAFINQECYKNLRVLDITGCCTEDIRTDKENVIFRDITDKKE